METSTHAPKKWVSIRFRYAELVQQHAQQGLSPADAAAAATAVVAGRNRNKNKLSLSSDKTGKPYEKGFTSSSLPRDPDERNANASRGNSHALGGGRDRTQRGRGGKNSERQGWNSWRAERTAKRQKMEGESKERGKRWSGDGSLNIFRSTALPVNVALRIIGLGALTASVGGSIHSVFGGNGVPEKLVFAFLVPTQANYADPLRVGVEGLRAACHGAWVLVERQLESAFLPALLCALGEGGGGGGKGGSSGGSGGSSKGGKGGKDGGTQAHHMYGEKGVPATVAATLAMYRNASCFAGVRAFAASVGKRGDVMKGVVRGEGGLVVEINWGRKTSGGTLPVGDLNMPGLRVLDLSCNWNLKGERK